MRKRKYSLLLPLFYCLFCCFTYAPAMAQASVADSLPSVKNRLDSLAQEVEALNKRIDISVPEAPIQEFLRAVANLSGLNINVNPELQILVVNNFSNVRVADLLSFLCQQYNLKLRILGNIVDVYQEHKKLPTVAPKVDYLRDSSLLSIDVSGLALSEVCRAITMQTGVNVLPAPEVYSRPVTLFLFQQSLPEALANLAKANNLELERRDDGVFFFSGYKNVVQTSENQRYREQEVDYQAHRSATNYSRVQRDSYDSQDQQPQGSVEMEVLEGVDNKLRIHAVNVRLSDLLKEVSLAAKVNYAISSKLEGTATLEMQDVTYEEFLDGLFIGKKINYFKKGQVYIIGDEKMAELMVQRTVKFYNRPIISAEDSIPEHLTKSLDITEFKELNAYVVNGRLERVNDFESFCREVDKKVPVIMIEVMIVDLKKSTTLSTGIEAGLGEAPEKTTGKIFPEVDVQLSTRAINNMIDKFNGLGVGNLGNVSKEFYLNIKALENEGAVDIKSTPVLSTLNGHQALLNIGETEYYQTEQSNITTGQNSVVTTSKSYENVEAKLEVKITPYVSAGNHITLTIDVVQSDFTERIDKFAPPGSVKREFKSKIRVKNQDLILLGGLEEATKRESGNGVPFLQRVPVLKWLFSSRTKESTDAKLTIFIKPTIIG